jgi:hypothetical protein
MVLLVVVLAIAAVGFAIYRGSGPLPDPEGCRATVAGHRVDVDTEQGENASLIAAIGVRRGLPARAVSIALATAFQESKLHNVRSGDRDSVGIFQQRPSQGWGTIKQLRNRYYAINAFYDALEKVDGYQHMRITEAAQRVQRSGFPEAYEAHAADARALASALTGYSAGGRFSCVVHQGSTHGTATTVTRAVRAAYGDVAVARTGSRQDVAVDVGSGNAGNRMGWSLAQFAVAHAGRLHITEVGFDGVRWQVGRASEHGWTAASGTSGRRVGISLG